MTKFTYLYSPQNSYYCIRLPWHTNLFGSGLDLLCYNERNYFCSVTKKEISSLMHFLLMLMHFLPQLFANLHAWAPALCIIVQMNTSKKRKTVWNKMRFGTTGLLILHIRNIFSTSICLDHLVCKLFWDKDSPAERRIVLG